jgi:ligand-binding sensor domain-containing protein
VKSIGGLAQFEVATGELKRIFTQQEGLPDNQVISFLADDGGVWIGTANGLAYYSNSTGKLTRYETPLGTVNALISDGHGGIWANLLPTAVDVVAISQGKKPEFSTEQGMYAVARLDVNKQWAVHPLNSAIIQFVIDEHGGVWVMTLHDGVNKEEENYWVLRHLSSNGEWAIYTPNTLGFSGGFAYFSLEPDGQGGIWVGMTGHVVHFSLAGEWKVYSAIEAGLPAEMTVRPSFMNEDGTLRVMLDDQSFFDLSSDGIWTPVSIGNL